MKQKFYKIFFGFLVFLLSASAASAQNELYWRESFSLSSTVTSDPGTNSTPYTYTGDAGTWTMYGIWTTTGTDCPAAGQGTGTNRHIRSTSAALGSGTTTPEDDTAYVITPVVTNGVQEVRFVRSRTQRRYTIWKTYDTEATTQNWILAAVVPKIAGFPNPTCADTSIVVNDANAKRIRIRFEALTNSDIDSVGLTNVIAFTLPVTFSNVKAYQKNSGIEVSWTSAGESNVKKYSVERSLDGKTFTEVGTVDARDGSTAQSYTWIDALPKSGNNFYRIKAYDANGSIKYTTILKVTIGKGGEAIIISPNPVRGNQLTLQLGNLSKGIYTLNVYNSTGQRVITQQLNHQGGSASEVLRLPSSAKSGMYNLQVSSNGVNLNKSFIVE